MSDEENKAVYEKCNNANGHGHNYKVEFTVYGPVHKETGMVMNIKDFKAILKDKILDVLDHRNLDKDVQYFSTVPSTTENLAIFMWRQLQSYFEGDVKLYKIRIWETEKNVVEYKGE